MAKRPRIFQLYRARMSNNELTKIDTMDGHSFEAYCAELLRKNSFLDVEVTKKSGDRGVDITCRKDDTRYAIQCKRFSSKVNRQAVQEIHAGKALYKCDVGVILTNSEFTNSAIEDASELGIELWGNEKFRELNRAMGRSILLELFRSLNNSDNDTDKSTEPFITIWVWVMLMAIAIALITVIALAVIHIPLILQFVSTIHINYIIGFALSNSLAATIAGIITLIISCFIIYALIKVLKILNKYFVLIVAIVLFTIFLWHKISSFLL